MTKREQYCEYMRIWRKNNPEKLRAIKHRSYVKNKEKVLARARLWRKNNPEKARKQSRESVHRWSQNNPEKARIKARQWRQDNPEKAHEIDRRWRERNPEKVRAKKRRLGKLQRLNKTNGHLAHLFRCRMLKVLKGKSKAAHSLDMLGCTVQQFREHLQSQFSVSMQWNNHGTVWEIDHIKPCATFNLADPSQQRVCFHYSNMQPLTIQAHRQKHSKRIAGVDAASRI